MTVAPRKGGEPPHLTDDEIHYPSGDGKPMAESDPCRLQAIYCLDTLRHRYARAPKVYVAGDNFVYYEEGNPRKVVSPDVYVVFGADNRLRKSYMTWRENGLVPTVVIEITSLGTWAEDARKERLYERLGVVEYFQFDPGGDYLHPRLQGLRLVNGRYQPIPLETSSALVTPESPVPASSRVSSPDPFSLVLRLLSEQLGLYLAVEGEWMRFYDAVTNEPLLSGREQAEVGAQARAMAEQQAAEARAEIERLRAELKLLRREREESSEL